MYALGIFATLPLNAAVVNKCFHSEITPPTVNWGTRREETLQTDLLQWFSNQYSKNLVLYSCSIYFDLFLFFFSDKFLFVSYPSSSSANPLGWICITIKRVYSQGMSVGGWVWRNMSKYARDLWISFHWCDIFRHVGSFFSVSLCACVVECAFNTEWEIPSVI